MRLDNFVLPRAVRAELIALQAQLTAIQGAIDRLIQLPTDAVAPKLIDDDQLAALFARFRDQHVPLTTLAAEAGVVVDTLRRRFIAAYGPAYRVCAMQQRAQGPDLLGDRPPPTLKGRTVEQVFAEWKDTGATLDDLGARLGVSRERVRQVLSCHPDYEAERRQNHLVRKLADQPVWLDAAWELFKTDLAAFRRHLVTAGITAEIAYKQFRLRWPADFTTLSKQHKETKHVRTMLEKRTPELIAAFNQYQSDPKTSIERLAYDMQLTSMGLWRQLKAAYGEEFRDISRARARGPGRGQGKGN